MLPLSRKIAIGAGVLMLGLVVALSLVFRSALTRQPKVAAAAPDWPAMTLVYRDEGKTEGLTRGTTTKVWRLSYQDARHWQKELLEDSALSANVGTIERLQGTTYTAYSAVTKDTFTKEYPASGGILVPEQWLSPGREQALPAKGYIQSTAADAKQTSYAKTESLPCQPDADGKLTGVIQPASCATAPTYAVQETITYQRDRGLPVEISTLSGQTVIHHIVVTELSFP